MGNTGSAETVKKNDATEESNDKNEEGGIQMEETPIEAKDITITEASHQSYDDNTEVYRTVGRPAYIQVDLDAITHNVKCLRECASNPHIGIVGMVKANAAGHGGVAIALHLKSLGVERLGVATTEEGFELRNANIKGGIHVFGNLQGWEMDTCLNYALIATVSTFEAVIGMAKALKRLTKEQINSYKLKQTGITLGTVHIQVDTGMALHGCQPQEVPDLIKLCTDLEIPIEGIFTHCINNEDEEFTKKQMNLFNAIIEPYRDRELLFHFANTGCILDGVGTDFHMMRVGRGLFGLAALGDAEKFQAKGLRPAASLHVQASMVMRLKPGTRLSYHGNHVCEEEQWLATLPVGHGDLLADGLSEKAVVIRRWTGERCPIVGTIEMDAMTIRVEPTPEPEVGESYILVTADYDEQTSALGLGKTLGKSSSILTGSLQHRLPRYYTTDERHMLWSLTSQVQTL